MAGRRQTKVGSTMKTEKWQSVGKQLPENGITSTKKDI